MHVLGFPGGPVIKNPPGSGKDTSLIFDPGRSTCHGATKPVLQSPRATTTEALHPKAHAPQQEKPSQ